ncbi:Outer membrane receptor proteins, mostly Fe transport [Hymenobacter gelipurpurascens]|uniref:Outer membrane receptor proteins, mostly Fe transport n=1 Tax=Hymenobacter gelipurpurascens TaxID=89968 RepID=A0A212UBX6_9BACT|nr:TonB-dependent receptor [Hymenobacter gelipurpurascens]SNC75745.1 Outer membrane receptor proteins, mostly Fe transport [Hymenobacter gelipurpurascens]
MKQFVTLVLLAMLPVCAIQAQSTSPAPSSTTATGTARLTGRVLDAATQKPIEYATVALLPATGTAPLTGATCDEQGRFELKSLAAGTYRLQLSFVGYATRLESVTVTDAGADVGSLTLTASAQNLAGVTVTGEKPMVETKPDRLIYNAEQDASNTGGNAADVLRKTPLVNLDGEGNVQLRGTSNVRILINNKPSALLSGNLAEALKQIPADQIKAIEVVTAPSAKYDAEGSGGVINIVLKKNSLQGMSGSVGANAGNRNQGINTSLNAKRGKLGLNTKLSSFRSLYPFKSSTIRTNYAADGSTGLLTERTTSRNQGQGGYGQVEITYDPSPLHSFTLSGNGNLYNSSAPQQLFNQYLGQSALDTLYTRDINRQDESRNFDLNAGYTRTFGEKQPRREWSVLAQHTSNRSHEQYRLDQFPSPEVRGAAIEYQEASLNLARNLETTFQTDYTLPFGEKNTLETGAKHIRRQVSSDYTVDTLLTSVQPDFVRSALRSNRFDYSQNVLAAYGTYNFALGKKNAFSLGTRLERTAIAGEFQGEAGRFENDYLNVLPNLSATRTLKKEGQTLRLSYSRRIQRPQIYFLNPYINQVTPNSVNFGNPELRPELADLVELTYGTFGEKTSLNASGFVRHTGNSIERFSSFNEALARNETTYGNLATVNIYGINLYGSWKPIKNWDLSSNLSGDYTRLRSPILDRVASRASVYMNVNSSLKLGKTYTAQGYGGFWTGGVQLQTRYSGGVYYGLSLKKLLLKEKADLTLGANNFLAPGREFTSTTITPQFRNEGSFYSYQRNVRLSFNYRFGKLEGGQRQRKTIRNDDSKGGGSGGGQQGG